MSSLETNIYQYLSRQDCHQLGRDMVLFYGGQVPPAAIWLVEGELCFNFDKKSPYSVFTPGLYFFDELTQEKVVKRSALIKAQSRIWMLTRSEVQQLLVPV